METQINPLTPCAALHEIYGRAQGFLLHFELFHDRSIHNDKVMIDDVKPRYDDETRHLVAVRDSRDERAFRRLFRTLAPKLKGFLRQRGMSSEESEDILQEVFVTIWQKSSQFDERRANAAAWVFRITRNKMIDYHRKTPLAIPDDLELFVEDRAQDAEDIVAFHNELNELQLALKSLKPDQRKMLETAYLAEKTHAEIQKETGLPLGTIKSRIRLGLEKLRHEMNMVRK